MAQTPWGNLDICDAHVHFFSHRFYSGLARLSRLAGAEALGPALGWEIPDPDPVSLAGRWIQELDRCGVRRACLIASGPGDEDSVSDAVAAFPDRFYGYFMHDPLQPDSAERIQKARANPHLHCICLFPAMHGYSIADPRLTPLLEAAAESHLAVFVHCGSLSVGVRKKLGLPSPFDMRFSNPLDLHPVAARFPQLRFVIPHFGAGLFRETLMLADLCPNIWLDSSSTNRWMEYDGLNLAEVFTRTLRVAGAARILFGTDSSFFPRGWQTSILETQIRVLHSIGVSAEDAGRILGGNLEELHRERAGA